MVPMYSAEVVNRKDAEILLELARKSIRQGLAGRHMAPAELDEYPPALRDKGAAFVTLTLHGQLRGCIGHLEASQPLVQDVIENARLAAFNDPRFMPLTEREFEQVDISISVLSPAVPIKFSSEQDLLGKMRPGIDGLILKVGHHQGTFLPSVWESLPEPADFLRHLKQKAGLDQDYWSDDMEVSRYTTQQIKAA